MHIVWDWNGTLFDDQHVVVDAVNAALATVGGPRIDADTYRAHYTRPVRGFYEQLIGRRLSDPEWRQLDDAYHRAYLTGLHRARLAAGATEALAAVAAAGATQSLLSMWRHDELVATVARLGLLGWFRRVEGLRGPAGGRKAQALRRHLAALDVHPAEVVVVGDALDDADAARWVGARCVLVDAGSHPRARLHAAGVPVVGDLRTVLSHLDAGRHRCRGVPPG